MFASFLPPEERTAASSSSIHMIVLGGLMKYTLLETMFGPPLAGALDGATVDMNFYTPPKTTSLAPWP